MNNLDLDFADAQIEQPRPSKMFSPNKHSAQSSGRKRGRGARNANNVISQEQIDNPPPIIEGFEYDANLVQTHINPSAPLPHEKVHHTIKKKIKSE